MGKPFSCGVLSLHVGVALHHLLQILDTVDEDLAQLSSFSASGGLRLFCLVLSCHRFVQHRQTAPALRPEIGASGGFEGGVALGLLKLLLLLLVLFLFTLKALESLMLN